MAFDERIAGRVREAIPHRPGWTEKRMFGGIGFLLSGNMCCGVLRADLILRLGPESAIEALALDRFRVFDITGRAMKGWVMVDADMLSDAEIREWIGRAVAFASTLPAK